jgi:hypothetical protein
MIFTHQNVDLDAIISVCAYCLTHNIALSAENVQFVPANQMEFPENAVLIDLQKEKHGHTTSHVHEQYWTRLPKNVTLDIDMQDSTGSSFGNLQMVVVGLKHSGFKYTDLELCQYFLPIVDGWFRLEERKGDAAEMYKTLPRVQLGKYWFLVADNIRFMPHITSLALDDHISGTIYLSGFNLGITRYAGLAEPDLTKLPCPAGWFQHSRGYLLAYGTRKANATRWNPQFRNLEEFIRWLETKFTQYKI